MYVWNEKNEIWFQHLERLGKSNKFINILDAFRTSVEVTEDCMCCWVLCWIGKGSTID